MVYSQPDVGRDGRKNCAYYIGSTKPAKLKEFIQAIRDEIDPSIQLNLGAVPFNGVAQPENIFDCSRLVEDTWWCRKPPPNRGGYRSPQILPLSNP